MFSIFDKLGGESEAARAIATRVGLEPNSETFRAWRRRGRISRQCSIALLEECAARGIKANYADDCRLVQR